MARLNIEDSIHKDARFDELKFKLGGRLQAMGAMTYAWMLAQKWYLTPDRMIPLSIWHEQFIPVEIIEVGLAEIIGEKVRMKGSDEQFAWLLDAQTKGKLSGEARRRKSLNNLSNSGSILLNPVEPLTLSPSLSLKTKKLLSSTLVDPSVVLANAWEQNRGRLAGVQGISQKRRAAANARFREKPSEEYWVEVIKRLAASDFCCGAGETGWKATFDFLLKPDTHIKIMEGKYDNKKSGPVPVQLTEEQKQIQADVAAALKQMQRREHEFS